jgi:hypothetical protein
MNMIAGGGHGQADRHVGGPVAAVPEQVERVLDAQAQDLVAQPPQAQPARVVEEGPVQAPLREQVAHHRPEEGLADPQPAHPFGGDQ